MGNCNNKKNFRRLSQDDLDLLSKKTNFEKEQILEWHTEFLKDCPSGYIKKEQFIEHYRSFYPNGKCDRILLMLFRLIDKDSNGRLEFDEFIQAIAIFSSNDIKQKINLTFKMYDSDRNLVLDRREFETAIRSLYELHGLETNRKSSSQNDPIKKSKSLFKQIDINNDNKIQKDEFLNACLRDQNLMNFLVPF